MDTKNEKNNEKNANRAPRHDYAIDRARREIIEKVKTALEAELESDVKIDLRIPPPKIPAHFAIPCFSYAKELRKPPARIAEEIAEKIPIDDGGYVEKFEALQGYLNIFLNTEKMAREVLGDFERYGADYGCIDDGAGKTVVIDYSSPNIAKPFSVGNIRSTNIGQAIYNILKCAGYNVIGDNHLGDWGTQFGKLLYAYELWGDDEKIRQNPIQELLELYVRYHKTAYGSGPNKSEEMGDEDISRELGDENPMDREARLRFKKLEEGDPEMTRIWKWFVDLSMEEFNKTYKKLGVHFDYCLGESFYNDKTDEIIKILLDSGIARREPDGSVIVNLEKHGISTPLLIQKKDGATLYATRDLAGLLYRIREFKPDMILYIVGSEQKLHFQQCFKVLELMGYDTKCVHVDFGIVSLKEGKMSTRKGRIIFFEDVLNEAFERAAKILEEKRPDLSPEERNKIAEVVGIGAVKFNDLSQHRSKNIVFDWDQMLSFDGDTAPYLQYSYARVQSILRKADGKGEICPELLKEPEEIELLRRLSWFPDAIREAANDFLPHIIAQYLLDTSRVFTDFYGKVPVLKAGDQNLIASRLALVSAYATVIKKGLSLLGIQTLDRM